MCEHPGGRMRGSAVVGPAGTIDLREEVLAIPSAALEPRLGPTAGGDRHEAKLDSLADQTGHEVGGRRDGRGSHSCIGGGMFAATEKARRRGRPRTVIGSRNAKVENCHGRIAPGPWTDVYATASVGVGDAERRTRYQIWPAGSSEDGERRSGPRLGWSRDLEGRRARHQRARHRLEATLERPGESGQRDGGGSRPERVISPWPERDRAAIIRRPIEAAAPREADTPSTGQTIPSSADHPDPHRRREGLERLAMRAWPPVVRAAPRLANEPATIH